jgi:hypothetical protein
MDIWKIICEEFILDAKIYFDYSLLIRRLNHTSIDVLLFTGLSLLSLVEITFLIGIYFFIGIIFLFPFYLKSEFRKDGRFRAGK